MSEEPSLFHQARGRAPFSTVSPFLNAQPNNTVEAKHGHVQMNGSNHKTSMPMQTVLAEEYGRTVCKMLSDQKDLAHKAQQ